MAGSILGNRVARTEDPELLTRGGTYVYDLPLEDRLHAEFVRSQYAHARVTAIDTTEAAASLGVAAVYTAADFDIAPHHGFVKVDDVFARTPLAADTVRFVGDPVAVILADTFSQAVDAAELVVVDYDPLPVLVDPERRLTRTRRCCSRTTGSTWRWRSPTPSTSTSSTTPRWWCRAATSTSAWPRCRLEPNSAAAVPGDDGQLTFYAATQMPHGLRFQLAKSLDRAKLLVIAPYVGGGFGAKAGLYHEHSVLAAAALRLGRAGDLDRDPIRGHDRPVPLPGPDPVRRTGLSP